MKTPLKSLFLAALLPLSVLAVPYDLTLGGSQLINGALYQTTETQSTGTGLIQPFLRLQAGGTELGLNSNSDPADLLGATKTGTWTHDVKLADLGIQDGFVGFLLDINQTSNNPQILFDTFKVYTRATSITDGTADTLADLNDAILRYDMGDNTLLLDYSLNHGSGSGDLLIFLPTSFFLGATLADNLYVVAGFSGSNDGFEEFSTFGVDRPTPTQFDFPSVPDNANTLILMGAGMLGLVAASRKRPVTA